MQIVQQSRLRKVCSDVGDLKLHPTVKPLELVKDAILDCSNPGELVLDLFGGSGTTLIACEKTGRKCRMMELDEHYCDVVVRRWRGFVGDGEARLIRDGKVVEWK